MTGSHISRGFRRWRLIEDWECPGPWNMAVDEAILDSVSAGIAPPTLRFYRWAATCITVGRFQNVERGVDVAACSALGVPIIRRPTGGRGVLHGGDETVSVVLPLAALPPDQRSIVASYSVVAAGLRLGLGDLGIDLYAAARERRGMVTGDCFATRSEADLTDEAGAKVVGAAQLRRGDHLLVQASIPHVPPAVRPEQVFLGAIGSSGYPLRRASVRSVRNALRKGFRLALGIGLHEDTLTAWEIERTAAIVGAERQTLVDSRMGL